MAKKTTKSTKKAAKKTSIEKAYARQTKADQQQLKDTKKTFQMDNNYEKVGKARTKTNRYLGITNPTDRIAKTDTEHVYSVNNHYKQAIQGVKENAHIMAKGQKEVNNGTAKVSNRLATNEGADANRQNDVRYTQAKHTVAADSATTRNKLSVNHSQNLNKITTNTAANKASIDATKAKANLNTMENYYKFRGETLKNMRVSRLTQTQKQRQSDKQNAQTYKYQRTTDKQNRKTQDWNHKENVRKINLATYSARANAKYTDLGSVNKAIKKMKASKDKNKTGKLTELYKIKANLIGAATKSSGGSGGGHRSGGGRSGRRYYRSGGRSYSYSGGSSSSGATPNRKTPKKSRGYAKGDKNGRTHTIWTDGYQNIDAAFTEHARQRTAAARKHIVHRKRGGDQKMLNIYRKHPGKNYW